MYKIYLNDNNDEIIKEVFDYLEKDLDKYIVYRNEKDMSEDYIIEECNELRVNMYLSINIYNEEKNKIYYNKNNSFSFVIYNNIRKEFEKNKILIEEQEDKKKDIVDIFSPGIHLDINKENIHKDKLIEILKIIIVEYFTLG